MLAFAWYLLKVLLCSGILFGYYWIALRNKKFHQYNRFYLLISIALSWIIPLMRIDLTANETYQPDVIKLLTVVSVGNDYVNNSSPQIQNVWDWSLLLMLAFATVSAILFARLFTGLIRINSIINNSIVQKLDDIYLIFSNAKGTPFSFFKYIFWNENIKLDSPDGQHILKHELAHVQEKHSADKLFVALSLIAGWYNPFMWLIKKELNMIHEFIADQKAIKDGDTAAFATMILNSANIPHSFALSNPFFYSPIKRRLQMITSSKNPRNSYLRKVAILPVLSMVVFFLAFKIKNESKPAALYLEKKYTVIIDAGHGGNETGTKSATNVYEKDITLQLATLVKALNKNGNIEILLTRENDEVVSKEQRLEYVKRENADLFISLHISAVAPQSASNNQMNIRGAEVYISKSSVHDSDNKLFGTLVANNLKDVFGTPAELKNRNGKIYVLDENKICPAVLLECGFITNEKDLIILKNKEKQKDIVQGLLKSIEEYFYHKENTLEGGRGDINPAAKRDTIIKNRQEAGKSSIQMISIDTFGREQKVTFRRGTDTGDVFINHLVVLDGIIMTLQDFKNLDINPEKIKTINVFKGESAVEKFGEKARNGVMEIFTGSALVKQHKPKFDKIFTRAENPPVFSKNEVGLDSYIQGNMQYPKEARQNNIQGKVVIKFIVDEEGELSGFTPMTSIGNGLEAEAIRLLKHSGPWQPAVQNGRKVPFQVVQQIDFALNSGPDQDISQAEFPGGQLSWKRYLERNLNVEVGAKNNAPAGNYTVSIQFNVSKTGIVSNVIAQTNHGFGMEKEAISLIKKGPKWKPATKNNVPVDFKVKQRITFVVDPKNVNHVVVGS